MFVQHRSSIYTIQTVSNPAYYASIKFYGFLYKPTKRESKIHT